MSETLEESTGNTITPNKDAIPPVLADSQNISDCLLTTTEDNTALPDLILSKDCNQAGTLSSADLESSQAGTLSSTDLGSNQAGTLNSAGLEIAQNGGLLETSTGSSTDQASENEGDEENSGQICLSDEVVIPPGNDNDQTVKTEEVVPELFTEEVSMETDVPAELTFAEVIGSETIVEVASGYPATVATSGEEQVQQVEVIPLMATDELACERGVEWMSEATGEDLVDTPAPQYVALELKVDSEEGQEGDGQCTTLVTIPLAQDGVVEKDTLKAMFNQTLPESEKENKKPMRELKVPSVEACDKSQIYREDDKVAVRVDEDIVFNIPVKSLHYARDWE